MFINKCHPLFCEESTLTQCCLPSTSSDPTSDYLLENLPPAFRDPTFELLLENLKTTFTHDYLMLIKSTIDFDFHSTSSETEPALISTKIQRPVRKAKTSCINQLAGVMNNLEELQRCQHLEDLRL